MSLVVLCVWEEIKVFGLSCDLLLVFGVLRAFTGLLDRGVKVLMVKSYSAINVGSCFTGASESGEE